MILLFKIGFLTFNWIDAVDILLVAILLYYIYKLLHGSVAINIFLGVLSIYLFYLLVRALDMALVTKILGQFIGVGVIASIILFQPEIRKFLLMVGRTADWRNGAFSKLLQLKEHEVENHIDINAVVKAAQELATEHTGALIVFSKSPELKFYTDSGDVINADVSKRLLITIFNKHSPMHDGTVIISEGKIKAVRCILPISTKEDIPAHYGLRHRSALGLTEITDSIVLIVSEETGEMSLAQGNNIDSNLTSSEIRYQLNHYLYSEN